MTNLKTIECDIQSQLDLNHSYMPFIKDGGLFIQTTDPFLMGEQISVNLRLPGQHEVMKIEGKVVWITPANALYNVYTGIGIQLTGDNAKFVHEKIITNLDNTIDVGGYIYGVGMSIK